MKRDAKEVARIVAGFPKEAVAALLTPRELEVLRLRTGEEDGQLRSSEETGKELGIGRTRVRQLQNRAIFKLERSMEREATEDARDRVFHALSNPLRRRILGVLVRERGSASTIAAKLGMPLANVTYHLKEVLLEGCGVVEVVEEASQRGVTEYVHRLDLAALEEIGPILDLPQPLRAILGTYGGEEFFDLLFEALAGEAAMPFNEHRLGWAPVEVDRQGLFEILDAVDALKTARDRAVTNSHRRQQRSESPNLATVIVGSAAFSVPTNA